MSEKLKKVGTSLSYVVGLMSVHSYYLTLQDNHQKKLLTDLFEENKLMAAKIAQLSSDNSISEIKKAEFVSSASNELSRLNQLYKDMASQNVNGVSNYFNFRKTGSIQEAVSSRSVNWNQNIDNSFSNLKQLIEDYKGSGSSSNLIDNTNLIEELKQILDAYLNWFNHLSLLKQGAVTHIVLSIAMFLSLTSLITVFYGDSLIKYWDIETKYPRIAKYIGLRRKFQQYYFFFNTVGILIILGIIISLNIYIFINE